MLQTKRDALGTITEIWVRHFDPHIHLRLADIMAMLIVEASKRMHGGIAEPNTNPHLLTYDDVKKYTDRMRELAPHRKWAASIYLTPKTAFEEVLRAWLMRILGHVKGYPPHGTTHSAESVPPEMLLDINSDVGKVLCGCAEYGIPYKTHGEVVVWNGQTVHPQLREALWYKEVQPRLDDLYRKRGLRQIHAHITTKEAARYMRANGDPDSCVCEITGHHLIEDWRLQYDGGFLLPDHHWLPVSKPEEDTEELRGLVRKKVKYLHAASDMAGHDTKRKYAQFAWGGGYTYHCSLELFVQVLEMLGVLEAYGDDFLYRNAKRFHRDLVPDVSEPLHLVRKNWTVAERSKYAGGEMTPFGYAEDPAKRRAFEWMLVG